MPGAASSEVQGRRPVAISVTAVIRIAAQGRMKLRRRARMEVERQGSIGPAPVSRISSRPIGTTTRLKNGGPMVTLEPCTYSDRTGNSVPQRTVKQAIRRIRLLNRKLDSRETIDSSLFSARRWSRCRKYVNRQTAKTITRNVGNKPPTDLCAKACTEP